MERLFIVFDRIRPLSPLLRAHIQSILVRKVFKKGDIILEKGQISKFIYFIEEGVVRNLRDVEGKEKTGWIMKKDGLFLSVRSFFSQTPARERIEALKDCVLHCISFEQLEKIYDDYPEFDRHGRKLLQYYYELSEERNEMRDQPAYNRYVYLMTHQPELVGEVPDYILASYLSMEKETFSAQKARYAQANKNK